MAGLEEHLADIALIISRLEDSDPPILTLPDPSVAFVTKLLLEKRKQLTFDVVFSDRLGRELFRLFLKGNQLSDSQGISAWELHQALLDYEAMDHTTHRYTEAKELYDRYILPGKLMSASIYTTTSLEPIEKELSMGESTPRVFQSLRSTIEKYLEEEQFTDFTKSCYFTRYLQWKYLEENVNVGVEDFKHFRKVGRGGFGDVYACSKSDTGTLHALKYIKKQMLREKSLQMAFDERDMLRRFDSAFVVALNYAFQTPTDLCFALDYMDGGDLDYHRQQQPNRRFSESAAMFYTAEILLGLEHIHSKSVVYLDLKPGNILVSSTGHVKITDLGLAMDCSKALRSDKGGPGTRFFRAPEVIRPGQLYDCVADWFSFGCTIYVLTTGNHVPEMTYPTPAVSYPEYLGKKLLSFLEGLLEPNQDRRLGSAGASEVKQHEWLGGIDWNCALRLGLTPPIKPEPGKINAKPVVEIGCARRNTRNSLTPNDDAKLANFDCFPRHRWHREVLFQRNKGTCFSASNKDADDREALQSLPLPRTDGCAVVLEGRASKLRKGILWNSWDPVYLCLTPDRLTWVSDKTKTGNGTAIYFTAFHSVREIKTPIVSSTLCFSLPGAKEGVVHIFTVQTSWEHDLWLEKIKECWTATKSELSSPSVVQGITEEQWNLVD